MVFNYEIVEKSWKETVTQSSAERNKAKFKYFLPFNLQTLKNELNDGSFTPSPLRSEIIMYPKKRTVQVPSLRDKIVQHCICDYYLNSVLTNPLIKETSACLEGKGSIYAINVLKNQLRSYYRKYGRKFYVLKCDIKSYFASIPHAGIGKLLNRYVKDETIKALMKKFVDLMPDGKGLALGLMQSQLLANLYLSDLDHKCKELLKADFYGRYMDDFYIVSGNKGYLQKCWAYIESYAERIGLRLNPKTNIFDSKVDFLGFTFRLTKTGKVILKLEKTKRKSKHRHINLMLKLVEGGELSVEKFIEKYNGWKVHASHGNCYMLVKKWDSWVSRSLEERKK